MLFRTHLVFSLALYFFLIWILEVPNKLLFLIFILFATIFVDIDTKKSKFGKKWFFRPLQLFLNHRGMVHSIFFASLLSLIVGSFNLWAGFGFFVGYVSHLFIDGLTKSGVAFLWPLTKKKFGFGIKTGGIFEEVIFVLLLLGNIFLVGKGVFNYLF
ncbi:MAG: metal-dependent hydrolase [archaeon]|nr:metal-dependent hydrolase [archaeon]MCR4323884.1 metal-dependent hydrolase [Nanoarchaeota archaeon]